MARDPRFDILFEPVRIGPVTAKNRFYQVPHCNGSGSQSPHSHAAMRGVKAEGGWAVINTEWCSIHPSSETPAAGSSRLWTDEDIRTNALLTEQVHRFGALAGCELVHAGLSSHNRYSRIPTMGPSPRPMPSHDFPGQARAMNRDDIRNIRRWHRRAVRRAITAEYDIVYLYVSHGITVFTNFLSPLLNQRSDEYGGGIENRARLLRETLEEVRDEADGKCAVAIRFGVEEHSDATGIGEQDARAVIEMLAEKPDLWDVNVGNAADMLTSRFRKEGWQEPSISFLKNITTKPVVGVGRFTSPDTMVSMVKRGVLDMIGAARPSIADPFLPRKVEEGRIEDIRECIGCNICLASDQMGVPIRCTQNPTMSEEWRRGWHPERIPARGSDANVLVVGAGPAGLEAARAAAERGYDVTLAEATRDLGGHLNRLAKLPGLSEWIRVRDWRVGQIERMPNLNVYRESRLDAAEVVEFSFEHVIVATGSHWRGDGVGLNNFTAVPGHEQSHVYTPDDIMAGAQLVSPVVIFDDDSYVMGGALAELLADQGLDVTLVTPLAHVSSWTQKTFEHKHIHSRLVTLGVDIVLNHNLKNIGDKSVEVAGMFGEPATCVDAASVVLVTMRTSDDSLVNEIRAFTESGAASGIKSLNAVGDCLAPGLIAEAVFGGHRVARELDGPDLTDLPFRVEQVPAGFDPPFPWETKRPPDTKTEK